MKTCNLSLATVVVGALAVSYSACSAQGQDNSYPGGPVSHAGSSTGSGGEPASAGGRPSTPTGSAGSPSQPGAAGSGSHFGGSPNTGVGGATTSFGGRPGTGAAGTATGAGGTPTAGGCKAAVGIAAEKLIDDLEDGDGTISGAGSRVGYWYTYNDGTGTQTPAPKAPFLGVAPGNTTGTPKLAAVTSGTVFTTYGAGMGFDFNNNGKSCPYDASAYMGIKFWAKANAGNMAMMKLTAMVKIPATTPTTADGGTCAAMCEDHYALTPAPTLTTTWTQYTITFANKATFAQGGFGTAVPTFDKSKILAMQFQVAKSVKFDFSVDDITFF
ncbi:MAG TPA: hypothetical protein VGC79_08670 [Polyangiaceae bacterium]